MATKSNSRTVLLPVDRSEKSKQAVDWYLSRLYKEGDVAVFLHVFISPEMYDIHIPWPAIKTLCEDWNYFNMVKEQEADALLQEYEKICKDKSLYFKTNRVPLAFENSDKIGEKICEFAREHQADMIVMNHSRKERKDGDLGSTSSYCVDNAGIPVEVLYL